MQVEDSNNWEATFYALWILCDIFRSPHVVDSTQRKIHTLDGKNHFYISFYGYTLKLKLMKRIADSTSKSNETSRQVTKLLPVPEPHTCASDMPSCVKAAWSSYLLMAPSPVISHFLKASSTAPIICLVLAAWKNFCQFCAWDFFFSKITGDYENGRNEKQSFFLFFSWRRWRLLQRYPLGVSMLLNVIVESAD